MATYYWVGGSGNWDSTATHWSLTSGGAGGAGVPTAADDVFFNSLSNATAYTVTLLTTPVCRSVSVAGPALGNVTLAGSAAWSVYGSFTFAATGITNSYTGFITFSATTTGWTITQNGIGFNVITVFNGVGGGWTLGSSFLANTGIQLLAGTLTTNNYSLTTYNNIDSSPNVGARTLNLGSSTVTCQEWIAGTTAFTVNAGTSTIIINSTLGVFSGGGLTYYNVSFTNTGASSASITGANTFNNLSVATVTTANNISYLYLTDNQTINGTLTISGASYNQRLQVYNGSSATSLLSTNVTLTVNAVSSLSYIDFGGITVAGASSPWSGTSIGDLQGNANITTTPAKIVYWNAPNITGQWGGNTPFATTSGGTTAAANFPLAQDTVIFDNTGLGTGGVINYDRNWALGRLDFSRVTNAATFSMGSYPAFYLDVIFSSSLTLTQTGGTAALFYSKGTQTLISAGLTFPQGINSCQSNQASSTLTLAGAASCGTTFFHNAGLLNLNNNNITCGFFNSTGTSTRSIAFGTGQVYLTGNAAFIWNTDNSTGLTITGSAIVNATFSGSTGQRTVDVANSSASNVSYAINLNIISGSDNVSVYGSSFKSINFTGFSGTWVAQGNKTLFGDLTFSSSMTVTANNSVFFNGTGTQKIISNGITTALTFTVNSTTTTVQLQDALNTSSSVTITSGTLDLNNKSLTCATFSSSNANTRAIAFNSGAIYLIGNNTSIWESGNQTNFSYTGTSAIYCTYSGSTGSRGISAGITSGTQSNALNFSVTAGSDTVIFYGTGRVYNSINLTGFSGTLSSDNWAYYVYGALTIPNGISTSTTVSYSGPIYLAASSGIQNIDTNGVTIPAPVTASGNATYTLLSNLVVASTTSFSLNSGSLSLNGKTLTCGAFSANSSAVTIAFGTSGIYITGNNTTVFSHNGNISYTGTPNFYFTYSGSTGTRTISGGLQTYPLNYYINAGTDTVTLGISTYYNTINFTGFSGTLSALTGAWNLQGDLVLSSTMTFTDSPSGQIQLAPATSQNLTTNGTSIKTYLFIFGPGTIVLQGAATTTYVFSLSGGTLNLNGYNFTPSTFLSPTSSTKSIVFGGATITIPSGGGAAVWNNTGTNFSTSGTGKISFTASTNKVFNGGGANYPTISQDGSGTLYINGNNTYQNMTATVFPSTINFGAGGTHSFYNFSVVGTAGNLVTVNSFVPGSSVYFVNLSGHNLGGNYMSLQDTNVTPVNTWYAGRNTTNVSNNTGWVFYNYYPVTATENATMADAETNTAKFISSVLEAFTPADTDTLGQAKYNVITTETSSLLDRITTSAKFGSAVTEGLTSLSAQIGNAKFVVTRTDGSTMADAETNIKKLYSAVLENSGLANSQTNIAKYNRSVVENFNPASSQTNTAKYGAAVIETVVTFDVSVCRGWSKVVDSQTPNWTQINNSQ